MLIEELIDRLQEIRRERSSMEVLSYNLVSRRWAKPGYRIFVGGGAMSGFEPAKRISEAVSGWYYAETSHTSRRL